MADADSLFVAHQRDVFRYLSRIVGQMDAARDLTQEVFLRAARSGVPEGDVAGLRGWVFTIARNIGLTYVRDSRRRPMVPAVTQVEPAVQELAVAIDLALAALDDVDRDVFLLREVAGLSYQEVAEACGLTPDAVRARLRRTRETLRESLDGSIRVQRNRFVTFSGDEGI